MNNVKEVDDIQDVYVSEIDDNEYNVVMHNDDITPFDFVIMVLTIVFNYSQEQAVEMAFFIHKNGKKVVATTSIEEAYKKCAAVDVLNEEFNMLLQVTVES